MPPKSQGESKQGLIITLVFFILATLGLGVATYFGFAEQEKLTKEATTAKADGKLFKEQRDWYLFQAQMYRSYMGKAQTLEGVADLPTKKAEFDRGSMKSDKDKEDVTKTLKGLEKELGWVGNKPAKTYEDLLAAARKDRDELEKRRQALQTELAAAKKTIQKRDEEFRVAKDEYQANLKTFKDNGTKEEQTNRDQITALQTQVTNLGAAREKDKTTAEKQRIALTAQVKKKDADVVELRKRVKDQEERLEAVAVKSMEAPASLRTDWKIVKMDRRGTNPYINLGSADKVKPQLTFSIHGVGLDGRPNPQPKGTIEVVNVIGQHLSRTRITSVKNANRDPILEGDVLYNPSWNPTIQKHVALAGVMDLTGDGRDSLPEFMRNLKRQNIEVDAWLDPKDGTVKGKGITPRTDFLILGVSQDSRDKAVDEARRTGTRQMQTEALKNGVKPIDLYKYLEMIGYRLPRSTGAAPPSLYDANRRPENTPRRGGDNAPPAMPPNK